ncbi:hypothetical protein XaCFBP7622_07960 [Xanthomonas arboricola]|nr:hypothetical protein XaCFBP7622_07960 [Xanthomonas arboricola]
MPRKSLQGRTCGVSRDGERARTCRDGRYVDGESAAHPTNAAQVARRRLSRRMDRAWWVL